MTDCCHVVPWYNSEEWQKVYEDICDSKSSKELSLNLLLVWKARCPSLPSGIESTLSLLQVHVEDIKKGPDVAGDQLLRLAYSSAIMRFVNHMLDTETVKGNSLYKSAKILGVPDWIVDLRHDTAHSNKLPHLTLLREACTIGLQWLQENYWDKYKDNVQDYISGQKDTLFGDENKIDVLINLCTSLSICAHPNCKIKNLSEIPRMDMTESIVNDVKDLFEEHIDLSNLKTVSIMGLINIINKQNKTWLKIPDASIHINKAILGEDSIFLSKELLYFFSANDFKHKNRLNNSYVQCFEVLLSFLHKNDLLLDFLLELVKITQSSESSHFQARLSAMWVSEILMALKRCQEFSLRLKMMTDKNKQPKKKKDLKHLYHHWFPSVKGYSLILDLQKPIPKQLLDINYIQPIIAAYNPYLIYFIRNLLNLIEPSIPNPVAERVYKLAELISSPEKFLPSASAIYTADDLIMASKNDGDDDDIDDIEITAVILPEEMETVTKDHDQINEARGIWRVASRNHDWLSCPIGELPWQKKINDTNHV